MLQVSRRLASAFASLSLLLAACRSEPRVGGAAPESPQDCAERQRRFVEFLNRLPARSVASAVAVPLPRSTLGAVPGSGPVLEIAESQVVVDGQALPEKTAEARRARVKAWIAERFPSAQAGKAVLYVAAAPEIDVETLRSYLVLVPDAVQLRLLVRTEPAEATDPEARPEAVALARQLLAERDPERRDALSLDGYRSFATCTAFHDAVATSAQAPREQRWPARRQALIDAAARCRCEELDTASLQRIASAEQRAGAAGLGALPASFLRDHRCVASMPRRSIGKLIRQMEAFDAEFAGAFRDDAIAFEDVLGNERLLNYFCGALPGETLAAQQRARATLYWRLPGSATCQAWRFEPLAPGAPMGTLRRVSAPDAAPLAFHYWQAAEEIRLFGPVPDGDSKPTDERDWACSQRYRLIGVDARSVEAETARWYFDEVACAAAAEPGGSDCVTALAAPAPSTPAAP